MAGPLYPDVPQSPGVPPVRRDADNSGLSTEPRSTRDDSTVNQTALGEWGIYAQGGALAVSCDSIAAVGYSGEERCADYPIERGGFESYDKVDLAAEVRFAMTKGGSLDDRRSFLTTLNTVKGDRKLYDVVTPEQVYSGYNVERVVLDRGQGNGAGMLTVEVHLREIRQNATAAFSASRDPASANATSGGNVQTVPSGGDPGSIK